MQGYQFAHMETWSRQGGAVQNGRQETVRRNGQRSWSAQQIIDEAERVPDACEHVPYTGKKPLVLAGTCGSFDELRKAHEAASTIKLSFPYRDKKTGKTSTRRRHLRADTHSLYTAVISLPVTTEEALSDPEKMRECMRVFRMAKAFEKRRIEALGGELAMAVIHCDERQVHMHLYGLDRTRGSVNALHPGRAALDDFRERHGALSKRDTNLFAQSKRAYCDAMREWQRDLHREVFSKVGLLRHGPKRARLSRPDYIKAMQAAEERASTATDLKDIQKFAEAATSIATLLDEREAINDEREDAFDTREIRLKGFAEILDTRGAVMAQTSRHTTQLAQKTAAMAASFDARGAALDIRQKDLERRETRTDARHAEADKRDEEHARRNDELDASLAVVEAMTGGLVVYDESGEQPELRRAATGKSSTAWANFLVRTKAAPSAAIATAGQLSESLAALRKRAAKEGLAEARTTALAELRDAFGALGKASASLGSVHQFALQLIGRLTGSNEREVAKQKLDDLTKGTVNDIYKAGVRVSKADIEKKIE
ncbi:hypothetical protein CLV79_1047 [Limimaricola soesokkakensis]|uniref:Plasmid recombination enzyme n=1 Tax=Limimaricola soesokkakensis TaxID=1343159 RepID=A0A1X6Z8X3_9RHOB|nr:hypothetical protein [Limimaricola soesokkakensis]PSK86578.1 hypothetical protein CLV79_1047 [Limimaricola soesokkakensis]SLN43956.1 hypothetical protein LOS8367_01944 [Limimaricola soesokkakensis]